MSGNGLVWLGLIALGAYHGVNPAMGWLFAVSRGLQERSTRAVLRSIGPIMLGHEAAVLVTAVLIYGLAATLSLTLLHVIGGERAGRRSGCSASSSRGPTSAGRGCGSASSSSASGRS